MLDWLLCLFILDGLSYHVCVFPRPDITFPSAFVIVISERTFAVWNLFVWCRSLFVFTSFLWPFCCLSVWFTAFGYPFSISKRFLYAKRKKLMRISIWHWSSRYLIFAVPLRTISWGWISQYIFFSIMSLVWFLLIPEP